MKWIDGIAARLDLPLHEREQVLEELTDHFAQQRERLIADGTGAEEAEAETARILGDPREVAAILQSVHARAGWKSALLGAAPFLLYALLPLLRPTWGMRLVAGPEWAYTQLAVTVVISAALVMLVAGLTMLCVALREIRHGRCHLWAATWLATGAALPTFVILMLHSQALANGLHASEAMSSMWCTWTPPAAVSYVSLPLAAAVICSAGVKSRAGLAAALLALVALASNTVVHSSPVAHSNAALFAAAGCLLVLISVVGARVFAYPAYGNTSQWSLFAFSVFVCPCLCLISTESSSANQLPFLGLGILIACACCVAFARSSDWRLKKLCLAPGIVVVCLLAAFADSACNGGDLWPGFNIAEQCSLIVIAIVFGIPAAYGLIKSTSRTVRPLPAD